MDKSYITFDIRSTSDNRVLGIEVFLNDLNLYKNNSFVNAHSIQVELPVNESAHSLKIILKNKTAEHTVLDTMGAIVQDTNIIVENIKFDGVTAGHNVLQSAVYTHDCNGTDQLKAHKFYGEMGCNGTVEFKFTTPVYLWLLENS